jgi:hypothetical protein
MMTTETRNEMIEALYDRLSEMMKELEGKEALRGTAWHADRVELAQATHNRILDLESTL